jgi:hypothetical protein
MHAGLQVAESGKLEEEGESRSDQKGLVVTSYSVCSSYIRYELTRYDLFMSFRSENSLRIHNENLYVS